MPRTVPAPLGLALVMAQLLALTGCGGQDPAEAPGPPLGPFEELDLDLGKVVCGREGGQTILEVNGGGLALFDGDEDGDLDLLLVSPGAWPGAAPAPGRSNRLHRNDGDWRFVDVTASSGVDVPGWCNGVAVGDVDADGRRDLYLTRLGPNALLRNAGALRFDEVPGAGGADDPGWSTSAVFVDLDRDGDLDLYVTDYLRFDPADPPLHGQAGRRCTWNGMPVMCGPQGLEAQGDHYYRNDDGRLVESTRESGFDAAPGYGLGVLDGDFDENGWPDLYVTNDSTPNHLFLGQGEGSVREAGLLSGVALSARGREQAGMGVAAGDADGDGDEDLLVTNFSMEPNAFYRHEGAGRFRDVADPSGMGGGSRRLLGWGIAFVDVDLDGDADVVHANGHVYPQADAEGTDTSYAQPDSLWLNDGAGRFEPAPWAGATPEVSRALASGDLDDDGVTDLVILRRAGAPRVFRGTAPGPVLAVTVAGPPGNPDGLGSVVRFSDAQGVRSARVRASAGYQASRDPRVRFAWRGPGTVELTLPDGGRVTRRVEAPGTLVLGPDDAGEPGR